MSNELSSTASGGVKLRAFIPAVPPMDSFQPDSLRQFVAAGTCRPELPYRQQLRDAVARHRAKPHALDLTTAWLQVELPMVSRAECMRIVAAVLQREHDGGVLSLIEQRVLVAFNKNLSECQARETK